MRLALILLCASCAALAHAARAGGFEVNGHALGDRIDAVFADERYDCGGVSACFLFTACSDKAAADEMLHGVPLRALTLYYLGERIAAMEARFAPAGFDAVAAATRREHGAAQAELAQRPGNSVLIWRDGRRLLRLEKYFEGGDASLIVTEQSLLAELLPRD
jgi:hypothetical protein